MARVDREPTLKSTEEELRQLRAQEILAKYQDQIYGPKKSQPTPHEIDEYYRMRIDELIEGTKMKHPRGFQEKEKRKFARMHTDQGLAEMQRSANAKNYGHSLHIKVLQVQEIDEHPYKKKWGVYRNMTWDEYRKHKQKQLASITAVRGKIMAEQVEKNSRKSQNNDKEQE